MRILHLEDDLRDAELVGEILMSEGIACEIVRVDTEAAFLDALGQGGFELVFADYSLPSFDGISALKITKQKFPDTPFIFVTGKMGEDRAIETLKHGATDYVLKDNLSRLVPAVNRALQESREKIERMRAEETVRLQAEEYATMLATTSDGFWLLDADGKLLDVNDAYCKMSGYSRDELLRFHIPDIESLETAEKTAQRIRKVMETGFDLFESKHRKKDGSLLYVEVSSSFWRATGRLLSFVRDITERKRAEEELKGSEKKLRYLSSELLTAQERERKRIAGELHDSVAASLGAIKFSIENILSEMNQDELAQARLRDLISTIQQVNEETRRIMSDLRPSVLDDLGIIAAISWFCREYEKTYSHISVEKQIDLSENDLTDSLKTAIFRVSQEAMNNIAKHSKASHVVLYLQKRQSGIELTIQDNGRGFDPDTTKKGLGLSTMRERAELSGGSFDVESTVGKGTVVRVSWPAT